jgi:hypothetical protein
LRIKTFFISFWGVIIQTSCYTVSKSNYANKLNYATCKRQTLPYEELSFIKIVANNFGLKPFQVDSLTWHYLRIKDQYQVLAKGICYENAILATMLFVIKCRSNNLVYENMSINTFVSHLWKYENRKAALIQIYGLLQNLEDVFDLQSDLSISLVDEVKHEIWES